MKTFLLYVYINHRYSTLYNIRKTTNKHYNKLYNNFTTLIFSKYTFSFIIFK